MPNLNLLHSDPKTRYNYDLSHDFSFSGRIGTLFPVNYIDCLPGDTISMATQLFARLAPLVHPIFQKVKATEHTFFVPYRLILPNVYKDVFCPTGVNGAASSSASIPHVTFQYSTLFDSEGNILPIAKYYVTILDYIGCPVYAWRDDYVNSNENRTLSISIAPLLAYYLIYIEYFADSLKEQLIINTIQDFIQEIGTTRVGDIQLMDLPRVLFKPCYNRDYFNTSQYNPQLGADININMPVNVNRVDGVSVNRVLGNDSSGKINQGRISSDNFLPLSEATLTGQTTGFTVNDLKELFAKQKWADIGNSFGKRYIEQVLGHFGVQSSDARLGRPDYIGSKLIPFQISEVTQLSETATTPLGQMAGRGVAFGGDQLKDFFCEEHGLYVTLLSIVPEAAYSQGLPKWLTKRNTFDFAWPEFATIGEQEVLMSEVLDTIDNKDKVFGYQERYAEYKRPYNRVGGEFANTLRSFTMSILNDIDQPLDINSILKPQDDDIDRVFAVEDTEHFYATMSFNINRASVLPYINRTLPNLL